MAGNLKYANTIMDLTIQTEETKMIIDGLGNGIICTDNLGGNIKFVNLKAEDYLKVDGNNIINKPIFEIVPNLRLDFKEYVPIETKLTIDNKRESFIIKVIPVMLQEKKCK